MANIAASVDGLNMAQWQKDVNSAEVQATANAVRQRSPRRRTSAATPTILVGPTNGTLQNASGSSYDPAAVEQALSAAVASN